MRCPSSRLRHGSWNENLSDFTAEDSGMGDPSRLVRLAMLYLVFHGRSTPSLDQGHLDLISLLILMAELQGERGCSGSFEN